MPSFADSMSEEERWAISYYVLSLSAWIDPHTGKRLEVSAGSRALLSSSAVDAGHPSLAVDPVDRGQVAADSRGKGRKLYPGIRE
jgi:cytochrome c oxidase cbb3-type subunit 2